MSSPETLFSLKYRVQYFFKTPDFSFFRAVLGSQKWSTRSRKIPYIPQPHTHTASPLNHISHHRGGTFVPGDEPTWTPPYHLKSIFYIRIHTWCCTFHGHTAVSHTIFSLSWKSSVPPLFIPASTLTLGNQYFFLALLGKIDNKLEDT